jgi:HK97 gp10 family phage protein
MTIDEFIDRIDVANEKFPYECKEALEKATKTMKKELKNATPDSGKEHKHKLNKSWKHDMEGHSGDTFKGVIWNTAPHYHLVERGHAKVAPSGRVFGHQPGTHFKDKTVAEKKPDIVQKMHTDLYEKLSDKF